MVFLRAGQITLIDDHRNRLLTEAVLIFQKYIKVSLMKRLLMKGTQNTCLISRELVGPSGDAGSSCLATTQDLHEWWMEERT